MVQLSKGGRGDESGELFASLTAHETKMQVVHHDGALVCIDVSTNVALEHASGLSPSNGEIEVGGCEDGPPCQDQVSIVSHSVSMLRVERGVQAESLSQQLDLVVPAETSNVTGHLLKQDDVGVVVLDDGDGTV